MDIKAKGYIIELEVDELWDLGFAVKAKIEASLKNHWVNHQDNWRKNEFKNLQLLEIIFRSLGRIDIYDQIFLHANEVFREFNEKKDS